ncbi:MAG: DUF819 family protein [Paludibacteraceae bacterium]|nr:DUF819 family protein [Paludibacteraceae bacterium]
MRLYIVLALYFIVPLVIIISFCHSRKVRKIGTVLLTYAVGILMSLCGMCAFPEGSEVLASFHKWQGLLTSLSVPIAIPLMLFNCDFKLWTKALPRTVYALVSGILAVLIAIVSGYFVFRNHGIDEFPKVAAMMTGIYTGGTMNFNALGSSLGVDPSVMAIVLAFEMVLTTPYIFFIIGGGYKFFRRLLPAATEAQQSTVTETATTEIEAYGELVRKRNFFGLIKGLGLSLLCLAVGAGISLLLVGKINELIVILTITTLAIALSFSKKVRSLPNTFELGMVFILIFSIVVASMFDIHSVNTSSLLIGAFVGFVMIISAVLHLVFCRLLKVDGDLFTVGQVALLCSPPFVPPVVGAMGNKQVLISGIVIGLVGYAAGTYLGVIIYWLLSMA